jgi:RNA polymerase sigma factor (TIGR02999 family)
MPDPPDVTALLLELSGGRQEALDELLPLVYHELRRIAHRHLRGEDAGHTLNTTALVHEAYLRLVDVRKVQWQDRSHFLAMASRAMRRILVDYARARNREKRGGGAERVSLDQAMEVTGEQADDLMALDEALTKLESINERQCRGVEYRFFGGMTLEEVADVLGVSHGTAKRDWTLARAWLNRELGGSTAIGTESGLAETE